MRVGLAQSLPYNYYSDINYTCIEYLHRTYYIPTTTSLRQEEPTVADSPLWKKIKVSILNHISTVHSLSKLPSITSITSYDLSILQSECMPCND